MPSYVLLMQSSGRPGLTGDMMLDATVNPGRRTAPSALAVEGLGKHVPLPAGDLVILQDIGFSIAPGETIAVVGASGSGKSTLLSLLAGLDVPSSGRVLLDDAPLSSLDEDGRARVRGEKVGFVFQN